MKTKILALALAVAMMFTLTACGEKPSLTLEKTDVTLTEAGATAELNAATTGKKVETVTFKSSDEAVATVDANGKVTAVAPGTATITATAAAGKETLTATATVNCEWTVKVDADLTAFYESLVSEYGEEFPANANVVEFGMLPDMFPGLDEIETEQLLVFQPMMGAVVCEIALVEVVNEADVAAVEDILQARIDFQIDGGAWYPETIEGWEKNSRIVTNGNYVMMIAWNYCDEAVEAFNALF